MDSLRSFVNDLLAMLPPGTSPETVVAAIAGGIALLLLLVVALRTSVYRDLDRKDIVAVAKRVEQLEATMTDLRQEMQRSLKELHRLQSEVDGGGESGGGAAGGGLQGGPSRGGPGAGGVGFAKAEALAPSVESTAAAPVREEVGGTSQIARGLQKSRSSILGRLKNLFSGRKSVELSSLDELEEILILSDVGARVSGALVEKVRGAARDLHEVDEAKLRELLKSGVKEELVEVPGDHRMYQPTGSPLVVLVVGVNGVGKTTTVAKLASRYTKEGKKVMVIAADTFRAAAVQQLEEWSSRVGFRLVKGADNAKPGAVVFDGMAAAKDGSVDVVLIDTAGRLHTKSNLMQELEGVRNSIRRHVPDAPHETIIVLDGVSGQNALQQAREFNAAVPLSGVVVTKLDGTPKGGIVVAISQELKVPVFYIGVGEKAEDLVPFDRAQFVDGLFGENDLSGSAAEWHSAGSGSTVSPEALIN